MGHVNIVFYSTMLIILLYSIWQRYEIERLKKNIKMIEKIKERIYGIVEKINKESKKEIAYQIILEGMIELIPNATKGSILMIEGDGKFHFKAIKGYSEEIKSVTLEKEETFLYKKNNFMNAAIITNPLLLNEQNAKHIKTIDLSKYEATDIKCTLSTPLYIDGELVGLINVDNSNAEKVFTEEDLKLANYIKNELQLAIKSFERQNELRRMANFDELTGVFNRRYFRQLLTDELKKIQLNKTSACIILIDLDDYKTINDTYGHIVGDKVLRFFADALRINLRTEDLFARISGDEFVALLSPCSKESAIEVMERIRGYLVENKFEHVTVGFSYGVHPIDEGNDLSIDALIEFADTEMYKDKKDKIKRIRNEEK